jgi:hypothetical protein
LHRNALNWWATFFGALCPDYAAPALVIQAGVTITTSACQELQISPPITEPKDVMLV